MQWDAQSATDKRGIQPATMPLMILASTAIDTIRVDKAPFIKTGLNYLPTDSSLFFTGADGDRILFKKQKMAYEPLVRWARRDLQLELPTTDQMVGKLKIPDVTLEYAKSIVERLVIYGMFL